MIRPEYAYHTPSEDNRKKLELLRVAFSKMADLIEELAPSGRHRSVALTHLETSSMFANKAVTAGDPAQERYKPAAGVSEPPTDQGTKRVGRDEPITKMDD